MDLGFLALMVTIGVFVGVLTAGKGTRFLSAIALANAALAFCATLKVLFA